MRTLHTTMLPTAELTALEEENDRLRGIYDYVAVELHKAEQRVEELETASERALRELKQNPVNGSTCAAIFLARALGNKT